MKNTIRNILKEFNVRDVYDLSELHLAIDQQQIKTDTFKLHSKKNINNRIKNALETLDIRKIKNSDEQEVVKDILWLWYHHACTIAIWKKGDIKAGKRYCKKALSYLYEGHPNKMTWLIMLLLEGKIDEAKKWVSDEVTEYE